jgi:hypothetical protein
MRTETIEIFKFDELDDSSKAKAIDSYRENSASWGYDYTDELRDTLDAFCNMTGVIVKNYDISPYSYSYIDWSYDNSDFEPEELKGLRLRTWLINNWVNRYLEKGKYYSTSFKNGTYKFRHSKIIKVIDCPFTGVCYDYDIIQPIVDFIEKPDHNTNLMDILNDCLESWRIAFIKEMEWQDSDEYIIDMIEANEYEFTEDGDMI